MRYILGILQLLLQHTLLDEPFLMCKRPRTISFPLVEAISRELERVVCREGEGVHGEYEHVSVMRRSVVHNGETPSGKQLLDSTKAISIEPGNNK